MPGSQANGQHADPFQLATYSFPTRYHLATPTYQTPKGGKVSPGQRYQKGKSENRIPVLGDNHEFSRCCGIEQRLDVSSSASQLCGAAFDAFVR